MRPFHWYVFGFLVTISPTVGVVKTWINGQPDIALSGVNTQYGRGVITDIAWSCGGALQSSYDDIVIGDTTGPVNVLPLSDARVDCQRPSANGTDRDFTRSSGADDYDLLNEAVTATEDYLTSSAATDRLSVRVAALTNTGGIIVAVQVVAHLNQVSLGDCAFKFYQLSNGARYYSPEIFVVYGEWKYYHYAWDRHMYPSAEAWTEADFNACEFGIERTR
jgi:hypothetical protein